ncbi:MAG: TraB/GumN family protein [Betaproteobacteria bacterium]|nr:TraB/GumN family protein [Betaproteobacteria bacterium]
MRFMILWLSGLWMSVAMPVQVSAAPSPAPQPVVDAPAQPATSPSAVSRKSFLWAVKSPTNTVYLFGTIHVGRRDFYPLPEAVEAALKASPKVVVEADISDASGLADLPALMTYAPPDTLDKNIPAELSDRLQAQLARLKIAPAAVNALRPFMVAGLLSVSEFGRIGYDAAQGVDAYVIKSAKAAMKPVLQLESVRGQISLLAGMPKDIQVAFLENTIAGLERGKSADQVIGVINAWQSGDARLMQEVADEANRGLRKLEQLDELLLHGRNRDMLSKIEGFLADKDAHFVAVGSLHLTGARGLLALLAGKGYEIKQL